MEIEQTHKDYDPYQILGLDQGADEKAIKKAWRHMSKIHHPDRGGTPELFDTIAKAHQALTDPSSRENWQKFGHPDGAPAVKYGIALPKFLVTKPYSFLVFAVYVLVFLVLMPVMVNRYWKFECARKFPLDTDHRTQIRFSGELFVKPYANMDELVAILSMAEEYHFVSKHLHEEDWLAVQLLKTSKEHEISNADVVSFLLKTHVLRLGIKSEDIRRFVVSQAPLLIDKMIRVASGFDVLPLGFPRVTFDRLFDFHPMIVQGIHRSDWPLLQLPHIDLKLMEKLNELKIFKCSDLAENPSALKFLASQLSTCHFADVVSVLSRMPRVRIDTCVFLEGMGPATKSQKFKQKALFTLRVKLTRQGLMDEKSPDEEERVETQTVREEEDEELYWKPYFVDAYSESWEVHCPCFPNRKQEGFYLYVECFSETENQNGGQRLSLMATRPVYLGRWKHTFEMDLKMTVPSVPPTANFRIHVKSDSYLDAQFSADFQIQIDDEIDDEYN